MSLVLVGNKSTIFVCPIRSLVTIPTELSRHPHQILLKWQAGKWKIEYEIVVGKPQEEGDVGTTGMMMVVVVVVVVVVVMMMMMMMIIIIIIIIIIRILRNKVWSLEVNSTI